MTDKMASETLRADFGQLYKSLRAIQAKYQGLLINEDLGRSAWVWPQARLAKLVLPLFCEQSARSKEGNYFQTWNIRNYVGQTLELSIDFYTYISMYGGISGDATKKTVYHFAKISMDVLQSL